MCKMSDSISNLAASLVKFNAEVKRIEKDGNNPHFRSKYATLDGIEDEIRPLLQKQGLATLQFPGMNGENVTVKTMLLHESGEWMESDIASARPVKSDPQGVGSAITYLRRYSLTAMLSLSTGDIDDDGNAASYTPGQVSQTQQQARTTPQTNRHGNTSGQQQTSSNGEYRKISEAQHKLLRVEVQKVGITSIEPIATFLQMDISHLNDVPAAKMNDVLSFIRSYTSEEDLPF